MSTVFCLPWSISEESSKHDSCLLEEASSTQPVKEGTCLPLFVFPCLEYEAAFLFFVLR